MITAQADGRLKGIASPEWNRSNSLSGMFVGQGLRRGVEEGDESILVDFGLALGGGYPRQRGCGLKGSSTCERCVRWRCQNIGSQQFRVVSK